MTDLSRAILNSPFFDGMHYAKQAGVEFSSPVEALEHFDQHGWRRGLTPSRLFDTKYYLRTNVDIAKTGQNPLVHFVLYGLKEERQPRIGKGRLVNKPSAPRDDCWQALIDGKRGRIIDSPGVEEAKVDVIIPVYKGYDDTLACVYSVLASINEKPFNLVVISDASPDADLVAKLRHLANFGLFQFYENAENLGFVGTVNIGMSLSQRDVVLLNSDTVVFGNWLDRLIWHVAHNDFVGTVTPMSNNATIFSYPEFNRNNNCEEELDFPEIDKLFSTENQHQSVEVPTGVGFCFYITRSCLNIVGEFNEEVFGKGYGEENDFCFRAAESGFKNLGAMDVYVRHTGEISFSDAAEASREAAQSTLETIHSRYHKRIHLFIANDPIRHFRNKIDLARLRRFVAGRPSVAHVEHGWGGGISKHIDDISHYLAEDGIVPLIIKVVTGGHDFVIGRAAPGGGAFLNSVTASTVDRISSLFRELGVKLVHIHSFVDYTATQIAVILEAIEDARLTYAFTFHDYTPFCPRITMIDRGGTYCDSPSVKYCQQCVDLSSSSFGNVDVQNWRDRYEKILVGAKVVIAPHEDVADRVRDMLPQLGNIIVRRHPWSKEFITNGYDPGSSHPSPSARQYQVRRVAVIGGIGANKGADLLHAVAANALVRKMPLEFVIFGDVSNKSIVTLPNVRVLGRYKQIEIAEILTKNPCDLALFLSVWPETFCYTLDLANQFGLMPIAFDIGAPAARINETGWGMLMPLSWAYDEARINDCLLETVITSSAGARYEAGRAWHSADQYYSSEVALD